jgi:hypothetical protein
MKLGESNRLQWCDLLIIIIIIIIILESRENAHFSEEKFYITNFSSVLVNINIKV